MKLWQLINPQTGEKLSGLQELPENWGPIFGLAGVKDRLGDLSWLGIADRAWIEVDAPDLNDPKAIVDDQISHNLKESESMLTKDGMTKGERAAWIEYQLALQEIHLQVGYPNEVRWPNRPE
jgi:hypothetical protein